MKYKIFDLDGTSTPGPSLEAALVASGKILPKNLNLNDDTLLEKVKFSSNENEKNEEKNFSAIQQICLLANFWFLKKIEPKIELSAEKLSLFLEKILENPLEFSIQTVALFERSKLESEKSRKIERSLMQMEELCQKIG